MAVNDVIAATLLPVDNSDERQIWEEFYPPGISWREQMQLGFIDDLIEKSATEWPDRIALEFYGSRLSFRELRRLSACAAKGLQSLGVGPGVQVALHLPNTPHHVICFFAILMAGGRVVNLSPLMAPKELEYQARDSEAAVIITLATPALYPNAVAVADKAGLKAIIVCSLDDFLPRPAAQRLSPPLGERTASAGLQIGFAELIATDGAFSPSPRGEPQDDVAALLYTGGTTGDPKGAMLTHGNLSAMIGMYNRWFGTPEADGSDKRLVVTPLFHISGLSFLLLALSTGVEAVLQMQFDSDRIFSAISQDRITLFHFVPTMYTLLAGHSKVGEFDLSSMKFCTSGGAPLPIEVIRRFKELAGVAPREGYALTETTGVGTMQARGLEPVAGNVGPPLPGILVEIVDVETGSEVLRPGQRGEICFRGPHVMKGYWKKPEATRNAFAGGRFHTGDIGFIDTRGDITVVDRKKDMIISGGYNVFPRTVEEAIYCHPAVKEAMVIGTPDPVFGQLAKAFIVLKQDEPAFTYNELRKFLTDRLAPYEIPIAMEIRPSLPKTAAGKLSKRMLVAEQTG